MEEIRTDQAPAPTAPYSQAIKDGSKVYVAGQGPIDPESGDVVDGDIGEQTALTMENIAAVLDAAGTSLDNVVKATVFLADADEYDEMNEVYESYMSEPYPARSAVEAGDFAIDIGVEIEVIASVA